MTDLRTLLREAAAEPRNGLDLDALRARVQQRGRRRRVVAVAAAVLAVAAIVSSTAALVSSRSDGRDVSSVADSASVDLLCTVTDGDRTASTRLTADAPASATVGDYRVEFSVVSDPERGRVLRADVHSLREPNTGFHPDLPPGVTGRAETIVGDQPPRLGFHLYVRGSCE